MAVPLADGRRNAISWATDAPRGFSLAERNELRNLAGPLGAGRWICWSGAGPRARCSTPISAAGPAARCCSGAIRRGDRRDLEAVILFADLRDFTAKAASWSVEQLLAALDTYYQALVDAITVAGGEVLKFMGDGLLAVFPIGQPQALARTCQHALAAALAARHALAAANRARLAAGAEPLEFGVALHVGRGGLRQHRRPGAPRLHRDRAGGQSGQPDRGPVQDPGPAAAGDRGARAPRRRRAGPARRAPDPRPGRAGRAVRPAPAVASAAPIGVGWGGRSRRTAMATALRHDLEAEMQALGERARSAAQLLATTPRAAKDRALQAAAAALRARARRDPRGQCAGPGGGARARAAGLAARPAGAR